MKLTVLAIILLAPLIGATEGAQRQEPDIISPGVGIYTHLEGGYIQVGRTVRPAIHFSSEDYAQAYMEQAE